MGSQKPSSAPGQGVNSSNVTMASSGSRGLNEKTKAAMEDVLMESKEALTPDGEYRVLEGQKYAIEIGGLEREDFIHLGDWMEMKKDGYGMMFRMGIKDNIKDSEGDDAYLCCYFCSVVGFDGNKLTDEIYVEQMRKFAGAMKMFALELGETLGNVICVIVSMPEYMEKELKELI